MIVLWFCPPINYTMKIYLQHSLETDYLYILYACSDIFVNGSGFFLVT